MATQKTEKRKASAYGREEWLMGMADVLSLHFRKLRGDDSLPNMADVQWNIGHPPGARGSKIPGARINGLHWGDELDKPTVYIDPALKNTTDIVAVMLHEMTHIADFHKAGKRRHLHSKKDKAEGFEELGLIGVVHPAEPGEFLSDDVLKMTLDIVKELGAWSDLHDPEAFKYVEPKKRKRPNPLKRVSCNKCGFFAWVTDKWLAQWDDVIEHTCPNADDPDPQGGPSEKGEKEEGKDITPYKEPPKGDSGDGEGEGESDKSDGSDDDSDGDNSGGDEDGDDPSAGDDKEGDDEGAGSEEDDSGEPEDGDGSSGDDTSDGSDDKGDGADTDEGEGEDSGTDGESGQDPDGDNGGDGDGADVPGGDDAPGADDGDHVGQLPDDGIDRGADYDPTPIPAGQHPGGIDGDPNAKASPGVEQYEEKTRDRQKVVQVTHARYDNGCSLCGQCPESPQPPDCRNRCQHEHRTAPNLKLCVSCMNRGFYID